MVMLAIYVELVIFVEVTSAWVVIVLEQASHNVLVKVGEEMGAFWVATVYGEGTWICFSLQVNNICISQIKATLFIFSLRTFIFRILRHEARLTHQTQRGEVTTINFCIQR
jgi:hypothetical protein